MAKSCAACGSHLVRHEAFTVSCAVCGAQTREDDGTEIDLAAGENIEAV